MTNSGAVFSTLKEVTQLYAQGYTLTFSICLFLLLHLQLFQSSTREIIFFSPFHFSLILYFLSECLYSFLVTQNSWGRFLPRCERMGTPVRRAMLIMSSSEIPSRCFRSALQLFPQADIRMVLSINTSSRNPFIPKRKESLKHIF